VGRPPPAGLRVTGELLGVAEEAARAAGALLAERFVAGAGAIHAKSTPTDLASEADLAAEATIRDVLGRRRPGDAILAEEGGGDEAAAGQVRWVVDPLDGTINFLFGIPQWCVSVAATLDGETRAGVIYDPNRGELFAASADGPATLGGAPVAPRTASSLAESLLVTGFGYDAELRARQAEVVAELLPRVRDVRRMGSAALDLAWLAAGRYDVYFERGVKPWDVAAGALVCRRAGLAVERLAERDGLPPGIVAGRARLVDEVRNFRL
jgi:myo-inositol-1(or 4)-monophosphatase